MEHSAELSPEYSQEASNSRDSRAALSAGIVNAKGNEQERPTLRYKMSREEFFRICDSNARALLFSELDSAISFYLTLERPVYLEGLGIITPTVQQQSRSHHIDEQTIVHRESTITLAFEKCYDLVSFHRDKTKAVIETKELAQRIARRLPIELANNEREVPRLIRAAIESIRHDIVSCGFSRSLPSLGCFYALHNRQGATFSEWFGGADIFLKSTFRHVLESGQEVAFDRPVLQNAWELFEAAHGRAREMFTIDLEQELLELGYQVDETARETLLRSGPIRVALFEKIAETGGQRSADLRDEKKVLLFCSDGMRKLGLEQGSTKRFGNEVVVQLLPAPYREGPDPHDALRAGIKKMFTLAWILIQGARSKTLRVGAGLSMNAPCFPQTTGSPMETVLVTSFAPARAEQLSLEGPFFYSNLLLIAEEEAALASSFGPEFLLALLEYRHLDQCTVTCRTPVNAKSAFVSPQ